MTEHALVIGEALVDVVHHPGGTTATHPGGSPANVALGLGRLGRRVELLTHLGADAHGDLIRRHLTASGVTPIVSVPASHTSVATAHLDAAATATYEFDLTWDMSADAAVTPHPTVVHTGSIAAVTSPGAAQVAAALAQHRASATITYDPNIRPALIDDAATARGRIEACIDVADVVKTSDEDLAWYAPGANVVEVARDWLRRGPAIVVVTRGAQGAVALTGTHVVEVEATRVRVVDTVGAGDSFMAALIDGLWSAGVLGRGRAGDLAHMHPSALHTIMGRCARIAAVTVSRAGANPPTLADLGKTPAGQH